MQHEDSAHNNDQQKINAHVEYLYRCAKLSLPVFVNSLTTEQRNLAREYLRLALKKRK